MSELGQRAVASTVVFNFTTAVNGVPTTLSGSPVISVYKNSTTESTTGVTMTVDYDSRTGLNHVVIDTSSDGTFYAASNDFSVVITTGTVGGVSVVGYEVGSFYLSSSASFPANFSSLLISASGHISNVDTLTTYTGDTPQTGDAYARIGAAGAGLTSLGDTRIAHLDADVSSRASPTNITAGTITTVTNLTNAPTAGDLTATMKTSVTTAATAATPTASAVTGSVGSVTAVVSANLTQILGTALTETTGQIAAAFKKFFNIATPASTMDALTLVATATNLTNAPTSGDLTAAMKTSVTTAATAATPTAAAVTGAVGSVTAGVTVTTNNDKAGYSISGTKTTLDALSTHGDSTWATATGFATPTNITAGTITTVTNLTNAPTSGDLTAAMKADVENAVWNATMSSHTTSLTTGAALNASGGAGDPWATALPGSYGAGTAGRILGGNLDAAVSSRLPTSSYTAPDNSDITAIKAVTDGLPTFVNTGGKLWVLDGNGNPLAPATQTQAIQDKTDNLPSDPADESLIISATSSLATAIAALPTTSTVMPADIKKVNGVTVNGDGNATPWGP